MLPLRSNRKPQLLPIKQLLSKEREDSLLSEEAHNDLKTDDYLLWKSENEPLRKKSVSFNVKNLDTTSPLKLFDRTDSANHLLKEDVYLDEALWDSDDIDDSLRDQLIEPFDYQNDKKSTEQETEFRRSNNKNLLNKTRRRKPTSKNEWQREDEVMKKLIENLHLTIKESIDDVEHNLVSQLEVKMEEQMNHLQNTFKLNNLIEIEKKLQSLSVSFGEFKKGYQLSVDKLSSIVVSLSEEINTRSDNMNEFRKEIQSELKENFDLLGKNIDDRFKGVNSVNNQKFNDYETSVFQEKVEEFNKNMENLTKNVQSIQKTVNEISNSNIKLRSQEIYRPDNFNNCLSFNSKNINGNIDNYYQNINDELEQYRHILMDSFKIKQFTRKRPTTSS